MRNKYPGICYRCHKPVAKGDGHFERHLGGWRVQHAKCAIQYREQKWQDHEQHVLDLCAKQSNQIG